jgi:hypothetical protein
MRRDHRFEGKFPITLTTKLRILSISSLYVQLTFLFTLLISNATTYTTCFGLIGYLQIKSWSYRENSTVADPFLCLYKTLAWLQKKLGQDRFLPRLSDFYLLCNVKILYISHATITT